MRVEELAVKCGRFKGRHRVIVKTPMKVELGAEEN